MSATPAQVRQRPREEALEMSGNLPNARRARRTGAGHFGETTVYRREEDRGAWIGRRLRPHFKQPIQRRRDFNAGVQPLKNG
jgi:hypothetical protein